MRKSFRLLFTFILLYGLNSCTEELQETEKTRANQSLLLNNYGDHFIVPAYQNTKKALDELSMSLSASDGSDLIELRKQLLTAQLAWQSACFYDFGPATTHSLYNNINIFPVNTEAIQQNIAADFTEIRPSSFGDQKGFGTLDYLFNNYDLLTPKQLTYSKVVLAEISSRVNNTLEDWTGSLNYLDVFKTSGGYDVGSSVSLVLNAYIRFYERNMRDGKLGIPLGIRSFGDALPQKAESYYGKNSSALLQQNLKAMSDFYFGGTGYGLDDLLRTDDSSINPNTIDEIAELWNQILTAANAIDQPIDRYVVSNEPEGKELYSRIQLLLQLLKIDVVASLGTAITYADTDGD